MLGGKNVSLILRGKLLPLIKSQLERSIVGMENHVGRDDFVLQLGMFALVPGILMTAHVPPRPSIKATLLYVSDVIRDEVVPKRVALVYGTPQLTGFRIDGESRGIANAIRVYAHIRAVRIELQNVRTVLLSRCGVRIIHIRGGANGHKHFLAVLAELNIARRVTIAARDIRDVFGGTAGLHVTVLVRKTHHRIRIAYIYPLRIWSWRIKVNPKRPVQPLRENSHLLRLSFSRNSAEHAHDPLAHFGDKKIPIGSRANKSRLVQVRRVQLHLEPSRNLRPSLFRAWHNFGTVPRGLT